MPPYERHVFICQRRRAADSSKGCCATKGSEAVRDRLKRLAFDAGLKGRVRVNEAGCLGNCEDGITIVVYPEGVWYGHVTQDDVDELFQEHVLNGRPVERLRLHPPDAKPATAPDVADGPAESAADVTPAPTDRHRSGE